MKKFIVTLFYLIFIASSVIAENIESSANTLFHIGQMNSHNKSFTLYIFTVYSAIYGFLFFNEQLEYYHYIGTILVFGGVYIVKRKV